jgi:hypothetical protein
LWHRFRGDPAVRGAPLTRTQLITKVRPIAKRLFALADQQRHAADKDVRNLAAALMEHHEHFFTFVMKSGVEPRTTKPRDRSGQQFSGAKQASGRAMQPTNSRSRVWSRLRRHVKCNN